MPRKPTISPESIILAAEQELRKNGVRALSLDRIAKAVGISKSGLLHHFPTREALLIALMAHAFKLGEEEMERQLALEPEPGKPGRFVRAYLGSNLQMIRDGRTNQIAAFVELAVAEPAVIASQQSCFAEMRAGIDNDGLDPTLASIIAGASDNLWFQVLFGMLKPDDPMIDQVHNRLIEMTY
jgi:AcrR family transcriptional regulator